MYPICPLSEKERFKSVAVQECSAALMYDIGIHPRSDVVEVKLNISFPCEDSCVRGMGSLKNNIPLTELDFIAAASRQDARNRKAIEAARDTELVVKLLQINHDGSTSTLVTECLPVWIKVDPLEIRF